MDNSQFENFLKVAASKLGMTPSELKQAATNGDADAILSRLDKNSASKVRNAMNDPKTAEKIKKAFGEK